MAVMTPRPAHPTPGSGPPDSAHLMPLKPVRSTSLTSRSSTVPRSLARSITVVCAFAWRISLVASALGSQPTIMHLYPACERPATVFCVVVDLPMPPFPYTAICLIKSSCSIFYFIKTINSNIYARKKNKE